MEGASVIPHCVCRHKYEHNLSLLVCIECEERFGGGVGGVSRIISLMEMRVIANRETERIKNEINILIQTHRINTQCCPYVLCIRKYPQNQINESTRFSHEGSFIRPEMEFFDINLTKDSGLFHAIHSLFYWRILQKAILYWNPYKKKIRETRKLESETLEFMPRNMD
jgi:hypothetical protein